MVHTLAEKEKDGNDLHAQIRPPKYSDTYKKWGTEHCLQYSFIFLKKEKKNTCAHAQTNKCLQLFLEGYLRTQ